MKRTSPSSRASSAASSAPPSRSAHSHSITSTRLWSWIRSTQSTPRRSSDRRISSRAGPCSRSPVFVARKNSPGWRFRNGASRSSESPYEAAVSMWLTPCSSSSSSVRSATAWLTLPSAAAPKIVRELSWPVLPNGALAITPRLYARRVSAPRVREYARLLVGRSIDPRPGDHVLVATTVEARPLAEELSRQLARRGAYALARIGFGGLYPLDVAWLENAPDDLPLGLPPLEQELVDRVDGAIFVLAPSDPPLDHELEVEARRRSRSQLTAYRARGRAGLVREVRCDFPTPWFARQAGLTLAEYEDVFYDACLRDWDAEGRRMQPILERFDRAEEVRIVAEGTDLRLGLGGRTGAIDDGHVNVPGGEVFYCPREDSAEGEIRFDFPTASAAGVRLVLRDGVVVDASADEGEDALHAALDTDEGARRFGELGLGCNEGITRHLRNVLFDEKVAGTVHLALGHGFPRIGGRNESALHWDLVRDLRGGGRIECDGEVVQRDGRWLL